MVTVVWNIRRRGGQKFEKSINSPEMPRLRGVLHPQMPRDRPTMWTLDADDRLLIQTTPLNVSILGVLGRWTVGKDRLFEVSWSLVEPDYRHDGMWRVATGKGQHPTIFHVLAYPIRSTTRYTIINIHRTLPITTKSTPNISSAFKPHLPSRGYVINLLKFNKLQFWTLSKLTNHKQQQFYQVEIPV